MLVMIALQARQKSKSDKMLVMIAPRASYEARAVMSAFGA